MKLEKATTFEEIPQAAIDEINFMLGDDVSCEEILAPVLAKHGYDMEPGSFFYAEMELWFRELQDLPIQADEMPELALDIYNEIMVEEGWIL